MLNFKQNSQGNSLIEIVVALAIFSLISTSLATLTIGSFGLLTRQSEIVQANNLANEGVEALLSIKDNNWNNLLYTQSAINRDGGQWELNGEGTSERVGIFSRTINFYPVYRDASSTIVASTTPGALLDIYSKKAEVVVSWSIAAAGQKQSRRVLYINNWNSSYWKQNDWTGGPGQAIWNYNNMYFSASTTIDTSSSSALDLLLAKGGGMTTPANNDFNIASLPANKNVDIPTDMIDSVITDDFDYTVSDFHMASLSGGNAILLAKAKVSQPIIAPPPPPTSRPAKSVKTPIAPPQRPLAPPGGGNGSGGGSGKGNGNGNARTYAANAYLESSAFQIPVGGNFNAIEWTATSTHTSACPSCDIRFRIKTAPDVGGNPGAWSQTWSGPAGDDGNETDYFATSTGSLFNTDCVGKRWIKYQIEFISDTNTTPVLQEVKINYN